MSEAMAGCPKLQGIAAIVSAFPLAHIPSLATLKDRHCYVGNTLPNQVVIIISKGYGLFTS